MTTRKKKAWSHSEGNYGSRVRVFEAKVGGVLYAETRDKSLECGTRCISLRHRDQEEAKRWAKRQVAKMLGDESAARLPQSPTAPRVLGLYLKYRSPEKSASEHAADERRAKMWIRVLGPTKDLSKLGTSEWQNFVTARRSGAINCHGLPIPPNERKAVRDSSVDGDLTFLNSVLNWASSKWRENGCFLLSENPWSGYKVPHEENPRQPFVTHERFEKIRAVAHLVRHVRGRGKFRRELPTPFPQILDLVWHTGRRISPILSLMYDNLILNPQPNAPFGLIRFPKETDKVKKEWLVPMSAETRAAIDEVLAERPGIGKAYLFPSLVNPGQRLPTDVASAWLRQAEILAGVPKQDGSLFHAYRRGWATARKDFPDKDLMELGGWKEVTSLKRNYQHADMETMFRAVSQPVRLSGLG